MKEWKKQWTIEINIPMPQRKFWTKLGFETHGTDDAFTVEIPTGCGLSIVAIILALIVGLLRACAT
jgi:hypothetical protein